ncbi:MAG: class I SAM-dependent methyltransferase [Limnochordales bacterium]|nr:class I SAM-dependent methyltransferase [Limnochordales bacterium]
MTLPFTADSADTGLTIAVTTSRHPDAQEEQEARELAAREGFLFRPRRRRPLEALFAGDAARGEVPVAVIVVVTRDQVVAHSRQGPPLFFHPGMAKIRIQRLRQGGGDPMITAMDLGPGQRVLDCTLGFGADAIVSSYVVGETGEVVGWESSPVIACVMRHGMARYQQPVHAELPALVAAIRRVKVERVDHRLGLPHLPDGAFDVVYFDPMFRHPLLHSQPLAPLRLFADHRPIEVEVLEQAKRVARRRVVVKDRSSGEELDRLGLTTRVGGHKSPVTFGIWIKE